MHDADDSRIGVATLPSSAQRAAAAPALVRLALIALAIAVYWPAVGFGYLQFDDNLYVTQNLHVQRGLSIDGLTWAFSTVHAGNWHPITWLSLMLDTSVFGNNAAGHHAMNIALHALNAMLLFGVLRAMTDMMWRSAMVAALFAVHPMHVESVAWISERKDVLSLLFWLLAMRAYLWYADAPAIGRCALVAGMMALGLMSKPMVVTLPLALLLLDVWPLRRIDVSRLDGHALRRAAVLLLEKVPLLALSAAMSVITVLAQYQKGVLTEGRWMTLGERLEMALMGSARYLGKLIWPADLAALYPNLAPLGIDQWPTIQVIGAAALALGLSIAAILALRRAPHVFVGWFWFIGTLTPVIGVVQMGRQSMADRYAYVPYIGLYIALVWLASETAARWSQRRDEMRRGLAIAGAAVLIALACVAHRQVYVWRDDQTLFTHAIAATDRNWLMLNNFGGVLAQEGRLDEALPLLEQAAAICSECGWVQAHLGETLLKRGRFAEAEVVLLRALELDAEQGGAHINLGIALAQQQRWSAALPHAQRALELLPSSHDVRKNAAVVLAENGRIDEALRHLQEAMSMNPAGADEYRAIIEHITRHRPR